MSDATVSTDPVLAMNLHDPRVSDIRKRLVDTSAHSDEDLAQIVRVLDALYGWREAERRMIEASQRYMHLGENDMKALRFIIVVTDRDEIATAGAITAHLGISSAATTKLLDRLERGGHIERMRHPTDRRALAIRISPETRAAALATVGREHIRRFHVIAALRPEQRETLIETLTALSETTEGEWAEHADAEQATADAPGDAPAHASP